MKLIRKEETTKKTPAPGVQVYGIGFDDTSKLFSSAFMEIDPKSATVPHFHSDIDQLYYVTEGCVTLSMEDSRGMKNNQSFGVGSVIAVPRNTLHVFSAFTGKVRMLEISTPRYTEGCELALDKFSGHPTRFFNELLKIKSVQESELQPFVGKDDALGTHEEVKEARPDADVEGSSLALAYIPPGKKTAHHRHPVEGEVQDDVIKGRAYEESYVILTGGGSMRINEGEPIELEAGDTVYIEPGEMHQFTAGSDGANVGVICGPKWVFQCMKFEPLQPETAPNP